MRKGVAAVERQVIKNVKDARHVAHIAAIYLTCRQPKEANAFPDFSISSYVPRQRDRQGRERRMIDNFSIALSHGLLLLAFWLLTRRDDLDCEPPPEPDTEPQGFGAARRKTASRKDKPTDA